MILAVADRADADVRSVVVGFGSDLKMSVAQGTLPLGGECPAVTEGHLARLRKSIHADGARARRVIHRFDGPYRVGELSGIERPLGLCGPTLSMASTFLAVPVERLENLLRAVREAGVEIENVAVEPLAASYGALTDDELGLGAAVLDFGAGDFRAALWEGGRLRQLAQGGSSSTPAAGVRAAPAGMDALVVSVARHFRIAPLTARKVIQACGAVGDSADPRAPAAEVPAVDELARVRISSAELTRVLEAHLTPAIQGLRDGLAAFSRHHAGGVVVAGNGARLRGLADLVSRAFGGAPTRIGLPRWQTDDLRTVLPQNLDGPGGCGLCGLLAFGHQARARFREDRGVSWWQRLRSSLNRMAASL
ncbi:MAG: hypothetical protein M5U26_04070 [Planctomycetota bacterium]|nr:hypothetical protein [Planctomycetota bacterium]